jgi:hypothetical protein
MGKYRDMVADHGGNLDWCRPYQSEDGKSWLIMTEGLAASIILDGKEILTPTDANVKALAQTVNESYAEYSGWEDVSIAADAMHERDCHKCPFFGDCQAMDDGDKEREAAQ